MTRDKFDQEFRCHFISSSGTLVNSRILESLEPTDAVKEFGDLRLFDSNLSGRKIAISLDPSEGVGEDSSCFQLFDILSFEQIGEYKNNMVNQTQLMIQLKNITRMLFSEGVEEIFFGYESNGIGSGVGVLLDKLMEDPEFSNVVVISDQARINKGRTGLHTSNKAKLDACGKFKDMVENNKIHLKSQRLLNELKTYVKTGSSFAAEPGNHDDLVSGCLLFVRMLDELRNYEEVVEDVISSISLEDSDDCYEIYF